MSLKRNAPLSRAEQEHLMDCLSDISDMSDIEDPVDDSDNDSWYKSESSECSSDSYSESKQQYKKTRHSQDNEEQNAGLGNIIGNTDSCSNSGQNIVNMGLPNEVMSDSDSETMNNQNMQTGITNVNITRNVIWGEVVGNLNDFLPPQDRSINIHVTTRQDDSPCSFYKLLLTDNLLDLLVNETNVYAEQKIIKGISNESIALNSLLASWVDTNKEEMCTFLGIIIWMGLNPKPRLKDYWSTSFIHKTCIYQQTGMPRSRFEALLAHLHFSNNELCPKGDRLFKLSALVDLCNKNFQTVYTPGEYVCIDESMIPFRGRLSFLQYIPGKRHKYGVNIFKLCGQSGYTFNSKIYAGKQIKSTDQPVASHVVMELIEPLLKTGRTLIIDTYYTSVSLAHQLNDNNTHLIGTLGRNRKYNPKPVFQKKLERGEMTALESNTKVIVGKWVDNDVCFLTTKSSPEMVEVETRRGMKKNPSTIVEYNSVKSYIDVSDQRSSYNNAVRRSIKWYRKVAVELLTGTAVVNALILDNTAMNKKMDITTFRELLVAELCKKTETPIVQENIHKLEEYDKKGRCVVCYSSLSEKYGRANATKNSKQCCTTKKVYVRKLLF